jgi:hypothetical protein
VQIQLPEFKMRKNSPLIAKGYPLSGKILLKFKKKTEK